MVMQMLRTRSRSRRSTFLMLAGALQVPWFRSSYSQPVGETGSNLPQAEYNVGTNIEEAMEAFIAANGLRDRVRTAVHMGMAQVEVPITHPEWVNARVLTFQQALMSAQTEAVRLENSRIEAQLVSRLLQAPNQEPPAIPPGGLNRPDIAADIARRILGVARGRLDNELRELGINPEEFNRQPEPVRHTQLLRSLGRESRIRASASLSGYQTAQTFEGQDGQGRYSIGVIIVGSQRSRDVAGQIAARRPFEPDPSRAGAPDQLLSDPRLLMDDFGVRLLYDRDGLPVILSFGQAGAANVGRDVGAQSVAIDIAREQAADLADTQIAFFIRSSGNFDATSAVAQAFRQEASRIADREVQHDPVVEFINARDRVMNARTDIQNLAGISTRRRWSQGHPVANKMIYGVVRSWSAAAQAQALEMREGGPRPQRAAPASSGQPGVRAGRNMLNERDY